MIFELSERKIGDDVMNSCLLMPQAAAKYLSLCDMADIHYTRVNASLRRGFVRLHTHQSGAMGDR